MLQEIVGVLSEPEIGSAMQALGTASKRVASCITRTESSRSDLVIVPLGLVVNINSAVTSAGQGFFQTILWPILDGSIHAPPVPSTDVS